MKTDSTASEFPLNESCILFLIGIQVWFIDLHYFGEYFQICSKIKIVERYLFRPRDELPIVYFEKERR